MRTTLLYNDTMILHCLILRLLHYINSLLIPKNRVLLRDKVHHRDPYMRQNLNI